MQSADVAHLLGDFNNEEFVYAGITSTFHESDGTYFVRTDGPDGELHDYAIGYTFGADPLQQYLIEFPDGRLQALSIAWDTRPAEEGGQRWFHLHPNEEIVAGDELHWTAAGYNWNFRCAECHSTNLRKGYDAETDTYRTTWTDINVGCEACHGPGSSHVAWAEEPEETSVTRKGLVVRLDGAGNWERDLTSGNAWLPVPQRGADETELCGRCHARRSQFSENYVHGEPLLDTHRVQLLDPGMYHADGQILDEVYVYGSFRQSRMYAAGVTCSDCHDPHSLKLRVEGDGVCLQCHSAERFATPEHHHHEAGTDASLCVSCHMPQRTYMVVDPRRDHSFRIPRPDLSVEYATPNACNDCHEDEDAVWAAAAIENWYGPERKGFQDYTHALFAVRNALPESRGLLVEVATDTSASAIARATAIQELGNQLDRATFGIVASGLQAEDPIVRRAAVSALESVEPSMGVGLLFPLLDDPVRGVRIEAARLLAGIPPGDLERPMLDTIERVMNEYIEAERFNTDHPSGWLNLGNFYTARQDYDEAGTAFDNALKLDPTFVPAYVNRAEMERRRGNEGAVEEILLAGL
ncbi:MAG: HEAT repeat domain-containing protein, partial [Gammaproteobacteria bacterium]